MQPACASKHSGCELGTFNFTTKIQTISTRNSALARHRLTCAAIVTICTRKPFAYMREMLTCIVKNLTCMMKNLTCTTKNSACTGTSPTVREGSKALQPSNLPNC